MYDIIGDIHGRAAELEALLLQLGYQRHGKGFRHESRKVIFLGDFVDRGPQQRRTIEIAQTMVEAGDALAVMGNHEFNAICFYSPDGKGGFLRARSNDNINQHIAFLYEFSCDAVLWNNTIQWFKTLPLWLDLDGFRIIHACWDRKYIEKIMTAYDGNYLTEELLTVAAKRGTWEFDAIETLLKGKEIPLPPDYYFSDANGKKRHEIRVQWWDKGKTYQRAFIGPESARTHIPDDPISGDHLVEYHASDKPLFLGHYWMEGEPTPLAQNIACLDYSVATPGGRLVAYRWSGESMIKSENYAWINRIE